MPVVIVIKQLGMKSSVVFLNIDIEYTPIDIEYTYD